jgi:hypothetical protein
MTITLESYKDNNGMFADIDQHKNSSLFTLDIYTKSKDCTAILITRKNYGTKESARKAMRRQLSAPVTMTFKF